MSSGGARLIDVINHAPSERAIGVALMDDVGALNGSRTVGFNIQRSPSAAYEIHVRGMDERMLELYERKGRALDPLLRWVGEHHVAAVADQEMLGAMGPGCAEYLDEARAHDFSQYMLAPIVVGGELVGTINFATRAGERFDAPAQRLASALMLHISTRVAVLRAAEGFAAAWDGALPRRELEIAQLAVRGLSTAQMARAAGISSNTVKKHLKALYRKLGVGSRVELGELLLRGPAALLSRVALHAPVVLSTGAAAFFHDEREG